VIIHQGGISPVLGLLTQKFHWLVVQGAFFVISVFLQQVRGFP
jgi:hypothetical protein